MNLASEIPKLKLRATPRRFAVEFLVAMLNLGDGSHLGERFALMIEELGRQFSSNPVEHSRYSQFAHNQIFFLVELYTHIVCSLLQEVCLSWQLNTFILASRGSECRDWDGIQNQVTEQHNRFSVLLAAIRLAEELYLGGAGVLPTSIRDLVAEEQRACKQSRVFAGRSDPNTLLDAGNCVAEGRQVMANAVPRAQKLAGLESITRCSAQFFRLLELTKAQMRSGSNIIGLVRFRRIADA